MTRAIRSTAAALTAALLAAPTGVIAAEDEAKGHDELAKAMKEAKVPLDRGVSAAAAREGKAISAKYEVEDGKLQLSVYTMKKGDKFSEVIVDHRTGKVAKAEPITSGDDLAAAKDQEEAMAKAKRSLQAATADATRKNPGYRAVSAIPKIEEDRPVAVVTLFKGDDWKIVSVNLDTRK
jgi:hypothetical protein